MHDKYLKQITLDLGRRKWILTDSPTVDSVIMKFPSLTKLRYVRVFILRVPLCIIDNTYATLNIQLQREPEAITGSQVDVESILEKWKSFS